MAPTVSQRQRCPPNSLGELDVRYAEKTMDYVFELWKNPVVLETTHEDKPAKFLFSQNGFQVESNR